MVLRGSCKCLCSLPVGNSELKAQGYQPMKPVGCTVQCCVAGPFPVLPVYDRWWVESLASVGAAEAPGACKASCDEPFVSLLFMFI